MTVEPFADTERRILEPAATAPRRSITWHSFDLKSGRRGPQIDTRSLGTIGKLVNEPTELSGHDVRIWTEIDEWEAATLPGRSTLVALDEYDKPVWEGLIVRRRSSVTEWAALDLVTLEAYFDRRYVKDHSYFLLDQQLIAAGIIGDAVTDGVPFTIDTAGDGMPREREYLEDEDKTVLSVLAELTAVEGGIEFTVDTVWADDTHTVLERVVRIRNRIGTSSTTPEATFTLPGPVTDFAYVEDFTAENGANAVMAVSSGEGDTRPESLWYTAAGVIAGGWARFERKITPSTSITTQNVLNEHAKAEVAQTWDGMNELTLDAHLDTAPVLGANWSLGDDVAVSLTCPRFPARTDADGRVVPGYQANVRNIGWEIDYDARRVRPRLLETQEVEVELL